MKAALGVAIISGIITLSSVLFITWRNRGSSSLALSTAAFAGAAVLLVLQMYFELQPEVRSDSVVTYITVDSAQRMIGHPDEVTLSPGLVRMQNRVSMWLEEEYSRPADDSHGEVTRNFAIYSLVAFLVDKSDWHVRKTKYVGEDSRYQTVIEQISQNEAGTQVSGSYLMSKLKEAHNLFADLPLPLLGSIYLPPKSVLQITPTTVVIRNPLGEIEWKFEGEPPLPVAARGATRINARITKFGLRAKAAEAQEYREWVRGLILDWHSWFEGTLAARS